MAGTHELSELLSTFRHGLSLDISTAGYILILPLLVGVIGSIIAFNTRGFLKIYTIVVIILSSLLVGIDAQLYSYWGFRLDTAPLFYLRTPGTALGSLTWWDMSLPPFIAVILSVLFIRIYSIFISPVNKVRSWTLAAVQLFLWILLIIPVRGGFDVAPINIGRVYFSDRTFLNHTAINVVWNSIFSLTESSRLGEIEHKISREEAKIMLESLLSHNERKVNILNSSRPDILLIMLESFTTKLIGYEVEGMKVLPHLESLIDDGIYFPNIYASGDRTDKGVVSILSGYPAQPGKD